QHEVIADIPGVGQGRARIDERLLGTLAEGAYLRRGEIGFSARSVRRLRQSSIGFPRLRPHSGWLSVAHALTSRLWLQQVPARCTKPEFALMLRGASQQGFPASARISAWSSAGMGLRSATGHTAVRASLWLPRCGG